MARERTSATDQSRSTDEDVTRILKQGEIGAGAAMRALEAVEPGYYAAASAGVVSQTVTYATSTAA